MESNRLETNRQVAADQPGEFTDAGAESTENRVAETSHDAGAVEQEVSQQFVVRWERLISTTNWEKGRIIHQWRQALIECGAPVTSYSDEAWARRVGGVTPQHVGRLRRVYQRFGEVYETYPGLYWSHFLAALDWDDAEMWLEGAVHSGWSVSQMRRQRWEAMGADPEARPRDEDIQPVSLDEDFTPLEELDDRDVAVGDGTRAASEGPLPEGPDFGEDDPYGTVPPAGEEEDALPWEGPDDAEPKTSPLANLPSLPVDLADAVEQFKLAIIRHRASEWAEVSPSDVVKALDALKAFVLQS